jgi:hypothetical protein
MVFDPVTGWSLAPGLLEPREHLGVAASGDRVYAVGGRTAALGNLPDAEVFDVDAGTWRRLPDMPTARGGLSAASTSSGAIVAPGGEIPGTFEEVEALDVHREKWVSLPPMPTPRHGLGVVAIGDVVYTLAGGPEAGGSYSAVAERMRVLRLDRIRCFGKPATVVGSPVRDVIVVAEGRDVVVGRGGSDVVETGKGADRLCGRGGNDRLRGGPGEDLIAGGGGNDRCDPAARRRSCERA